MLLDTFHTLGPLLASSVPTRLDALLKLVGRLHVATVHFPIALLIAAALFEFLRSRRSAPAPSPAALRCLILGALAALAAAAMGWLNAAQEIAGASASGGGTGGGEWRGEGIVVSWHRWLGVAASALAVLTLLVALPAVWKPDGRAFPLYRLLLLASAALVGLTGHYGGRLTHGDHYLAAPIAALLRGPAAAPPPPPPAANADTLEARAVAILEHSCTSCHGRGKTKGGLSLVSRQAALRGGKHGPSITPGQPDLSELIARLVTDDPDLIMPADADPLPPEQIDTLRRWIRDGAKWPEPAAGSGSASVVSPDTRSPDHFTGVLRSAFLAPFPPSAFDQPTPSR
ncbi:MAG: c-type cytochrome domain-containing protein [Phycisphaerales bacterium]